MVGETEDVAGKSEAIVVVMILENWLIFYIKRQSARYFRSLD